MKKSLVLVGIVLAALGLLAAACGPDYQKQAEDLKKANDTLTAEKAKIQKDLDAAKTALGPPPASLDQYYPPKSPAPVWFLQMLAISDANTNMGNDLAQGDLAGVKANYAKFKTEWVKTSKMVPEWEALFPMGPVDDLGKAIDGGDTAAITAARGKIGPLCGACHSVNRNKVHQKYYWPSFAAAKVTDPVTKQSLAWFNYMFLVEGSFAGIGNDLGQGQLANAIKHYDDFAARFAALREGCKNCHATPRTYFVDPSVQADIDALGAALKATPPNPAAAGPLFGKIGAASCGGCHLVHFPAATAQRSFAAAAAAAAAPAAPPATPTRPAAPR